MTDAGLGSREKRFLLECAGHAIVGDRAPRVQEILDESLDWTAVVRAALGHKIVPLLHLALLPGGFPGVPREVKTALRVYFEDNRERNHHLVRELRMSFELFAARGVEAIAFKGPTLAQLAYRSLEARQAGDLDFLVRAEDVDAVLEVLAGRGFQLEYGAGELTPGQHALFRRHQSEYCLSRATDMLLVEPHWAISPGTLAVQRDQAGLWRRSRSVELGGSSFATLSLEDLVSVLCEHGSKHQWTELRHVCDLAALLHRHPGLDDERLHRRAREEGQSRMLALGLGLAKELLAAPLDAASLELVEHDRVASRLRAEIRENLFREERPVPAILDLSLFRIRMRERSRDKLAYAFRTATAPHLRHYRMVSLPSRLVFLYYPLRLADYAIRPAWRLFRRLTRPVAPDKAATTRVREAWAARTDLWDGPGRARVAAPSDGALLDAVGIRPGLRILDLASGAGNPVLDIARRMGNEGFILASDLVPGMVSRTRERLSAAGHAEVRFAAADIQALPFRDGSFDGVVCRLGIMFCPAIEAALAEVRRVLAPGGIAAFTVWGPREDNTVFRVLESVVGRGSGAPEFTPLRFGEPDSLRRLLARAGFRNVEERSFVSEYVVPREQAFWRQSLTLHYGAWLDSLPARARTALEETVESAFADYRTEEGYRLRSHVRICSGAKP